MRQTLVAGVALLIVITPASSSPLNGSYRIVQLSGQPVDWVGTVEVQGDRVALQSPCNSYAASWKADGGGNLTVDLPMIGTQAICTSAELAAADAALRASASRAELLTHAGDRLQLLGNGVILVEAVR